MVIDNYQSLSFLISEKQNQAEGEKRRDHGFLKRLLKYACRAIG
jgi:hypothetical protein